MKKSIILFLLFIGALPMATLAQEEPIAVTLSASGEVWVARDGKTITLAAKDLLNKSDAVTTGAIGRAQLLFRDDSIIAMAPDTELDLSDFSFEETNAPSFIANMAKGVARFVSGEIVKKNPEGFNINTPHSSISIRGTTITAIITRDTSSVIINDATQGLPVYMTSNKTGASVYSDIANKVLTIDELGAAVIRDATPEEMRISQVVTKAVGSGDDLSASSTNRRDTLLGSEIAVYTSREYTTATYSGTIETTGMLSASGNFSFKVDLINSNCYDGIVNLADPSSSTLSAVNGVGVVGGGYATSVVFSQADISGTGLYAGTDSITLSGTLTNDLSAFQNGYIYAESGGYMIDYKTNISGTGAFE